MTLFRAFFAFSLLLVVCESEETQSLNGNWMVKDENEEYKDLKATVPGGIYSDLMDNNIIGDVFYGYNDNTTKWVSRTNWTYYTTFDVEDNILNNENVNVVFEGLDTLASVFINDVNVGESKNMFLRYVYDVKDVLKAGSNKIEVRFQSPVEAAARLADEQDKLYRIPLECPPDEYRGDCHANMLRKMQASFSWDWGPSFPSTGIWKDVYLQAYNESVIRYVVADVVEKDDDTWVINIDTYFANNERNRVVGELSYEMKADTLSLLTVSKVDVKPNEYNEIVFTDTIEISKAGVTTWWPNGYGAQKLYSLNLTFADLNDTDQSERSVRIGFRTIELLQDTLDSGLLFYFKVNGVPIFLKGSNEIPLNILPEKGQDKALIRRLLSDAQEVHMNMLRVWGGGVYESDYFYDVADELGILIWQDFMFACSLYPANENYLSNVVEEVRHQVKRLRSHASIAIYSGNNENEGALRDNWYGTSENFTLYKEDYIKLYIDTIEKEFDRLTHNRGIYVSSSPSNGKDTVTEGYVASYPGSPFYGDVHFYNYVLDPFNSNYYPIPRFASEYGYQALPSIEAWLTATNNTADLDINSDFMDHRQHHPSGNLQMKLLLDFNIDLPSESSSNYSKAFIYYSQIGSALGIKIESEHYRRYRSYFDGEGHGNTMGALYWQLNDVWVAPTWSGIDFTGSWKMLHYLAKDFFAPVIITGHINAERVLQVYVVSDLLTTFEDVTVNIKVFKWDSLTAIDDNEFTTNVQSGKSDLIWSNNTDNFLESKNCGTSSDARYQCLIYLTLRKGDIIVSPDNYVFPAELKYSNVQQPNLEISSVKSISETSYEIVLTTDKIALFVWLDSHQIKGKFSENGFVQVDAQRTVYFTSEEATTVNDVQQALTVTNLKDPQYFS